MNSLHNRVLAGVIGAIVLLALGVMLLSSATRVADTAPGTPEGTVQRYLKATFAHDAERAATYLDPASSCTADQLAQSYVEPGTRAELVSSTISGSTARVEVVLTVPTGGPIPDFGDQSIVFRLARSGDRWVLTGAPWPMYDCGGIFK